MKLRLPICRLLVAALVAFSAQYAGAGNPPTNAAIERPFATLYLSSLSAFRSDCERVFESIQRHDLYASMDSRLRRYNDFSGIDRDKPVGMMFLWASESTPQVVFVPVVQIDDLLKTVSFGVGTSQQIRTDQYQIGRTERPYQVLVRQEYALISESLPTIRGIRTSPEQLTRRLRDQYDLVLHFELQQIPLAYKRQVLADLRATILPGLQQGDDELKEVSSVRRIFGQVLLSSIDRLIMDLRTLTIGAKIDPDSKRLQIEVTADALSKSTLATAFQQVSVKPRKFSSFMQDERDAAAIGGISFTVPSRSAQSPARANEKRSRGDCRIETLLQLLGERPGERSLLMGVSSDEAELLNDAFPMLVNAAKQTDLIEHVDEVANSVPGLRAHTLALRDVPSLLRDWIGPNPEMILGKSQDALWFGIGAPANLLADLEDAIQLADSSAKDRPMSANWTAKLSGSAVPEFVSSNPLIPNMDVPRVREELNRGDDGVRITVGPVPDGIKVSFDFETGFIRLIGRDWVRQIEAFYGGQ